MTTCYENLCCDRPLFNYSLQAYPVYSNSEITFFIPCPSGFSCDSPTIEITIPAGTVTYRPTTPEDDTPENVAEVLEGYAYGVAYSRALPRFNIEIPRFYNREITLTCTGTQVALPFTENIPFLVSQGVVTVPAGTFSHTLSQAAVDFQATVVATSVFNTYVSCHWENTEQSVSCPVGEFGGPFVVTAGTFESTISQADADAQALALAQAQADAGCTTCQNFPIQDLVWDIQSLNPANTIAASGGTGSGTLVNDFMSCEAHLLNSCNDYVMNINIPYTLRAPALAFPPNTFRFIELHIDDVLVASDLLLLPGAGCASKVGTLNVNHTIGSDAFYTANGYHKIYLYIGQNVAGIPDSPACATVYTMSITPLTPP